MRLVVFGAGMYVTGRSKTGSGTILASLCEASRTLPLEHVTIAARNPANAAEVADAAGLLNQRLGTSLSVDFISIPDDAENGVEAAVAASQADAAIICLPDHLHHSYALRVLERSLHCLVVKPFTPTLAEGKELASLQHAKGVVGAVEFHKRWDEQNLLARSLLKRGEIGDLLYSVIQYSQRIDIPRDVFRSWSSQTNIFQYLGVHYADLIYFLTGAHPLRLSAIGTWNVLASLGIDTPDAVHVTILWSPVSGGVPFVTQFATNWIDPSCTTALSDQRYNLVGTAGRLDLDQRDRGVVLSSAAGGVKTINPYFAEFLSSPYGREYYSGYGPRSIIQFVEDVAHVSCGKLVPSALEGLRPTFRDALVSTAIIETVNKSLLKHGSWEDIPDVKA